MRLIYKIVFFVSVSLLVASFVVAVIFPLRLGVDFTGGSVIELNFSNNRPSLDELNQTVKAIPGVKDVSSGLIGNKEALLRLNSLSDPTHQQILHTISEKFGQVTET